MFINLPAWGIVLLNVLGIPLAHLSFAWLTTKLPSSFFNPTSRLYRTRTWEKEGEVYQKWFRVRRWKDRLPDGASWLSGFAKGSLQSRDADYLRQFQRETCRGEFSHWVQMLVIASFLIWNPFPANLIIITYAILSNLPCIISQRNSRPRLERAIRGALRGSSVL